VKMSIFRLFLAWNIKLSDSFDGLVFRDRPSFVVDGCDNSKKLVEEYVHKGFRVVDVGGGRHPFFSANRKSELALKVIGLDISMEELMKAPQNAYDELVCMAVENFEGTLDADLVVCIAVLEHVRSSRLAISSISRMLKPGGRALIFVPSRTALLTRRNLMLPETWKRRLLYFTFPETVKTSGFKSYYDDCTPRQVRANVESSGCTAERELYFFSSGYFRVFFPMHVCWRVWLVIFRLLRGKQAAETFTFIIRKL